jgi:hypothetical protein
MTAPLWHQTETYKSLISFAIELFKILALINGGAAIALLSFVGANRAEIGDIEGFKTALIGFALGVICVPLALMMGYFTQFAMFYEGEGRFKRRYHLVWLAFGLLFVLLSGAAFVIATWQAANAF